MSEPAKEFWKPSEEFFEGSVTLRILPPPADKSYYEFTRAHRVAEDWIAGRKGPCRCPVCVFKEEQAMKDENERKFRELYVNNQKGTENWLKANGWVKKDGRSGWHKDGLVVERSGWAVSPGWKVSNLGIRFAMVRVTHLTCDTDLALACNELAKKIRFLYERMARTCGEVQAIADSSDRSPFIPSTAMVA